MIRMKENRTVESLYDYGARRGKWCCYWAWGWFFRFNFIRSNTSIAKLINVHILPRVRVFKSITLCRIPRTILLSVYHTRYPSLASSQHASTRCPCSNPPPSRASSSDKPANSPGRPPGSQYLWAFPLTCATRDREMHQKICFV